MTVESVLITGGTGFVGSAIVRALIDKYPTCRITVLDATVSEKIIQWRGIKTSNVDFVEADITDGDAVRKALLQAKPQAVVHTAGFVPPLEERYGRRLEKAAFHINLEGTRKVLESSQAAGVQAFVYTSSCCVVIDDVSQSYANIDERWPTVQRGTATIYAESKAEAEQLVLTSYDKSESKSGILTCALRPATTFGEGDHQLGPSILSCIIDKFESPFQVGNATNMWDTVYVGNVADAHVLAIENLLSDNPNAAGEAFFIQNNEPTTFREFTLQLWKTYNGHIPPFTVQIPEGLAWTLGFIAEVWTRVTGTPATLSRGSVLDACAVRYASGEKAKRILGFEPRVSLEEGLKRSCLEYAQRRKGGSHPKSNGQLLVQKLKEIMAD